MYQNTIWITGAEGKLGSAIARLLEEDRTNKIITTDKDVEITDVEAVQQHTDLYRPTVIINCAGLSDREYCEKNMVEAFRINGLGARNLAAASRRVNAKIIHMSSDDVFSGKRADKLTEFDMPEPDTVYGKSKLVGENYVRELNPKHLIVRSSWVYGTGKGDYVSKVLEYAKKGEQFNAPLDVISSPTSAIDLSRFVCSLVETTEYGLYHASCEGACSRNEFARYILRLAGYDTNLAMGSFEYRNGVCSTLLENLMMKMTEIYEMPHWQKALEEYIGILKGEGKI